LDDQWTLDNKGRLHHGKIVQHIHELAIKENDILEAKVEEGRIFYFVNGAKI